MYRWMLCEEECLFSRIIFHQLLEVALIYILLIFKPYILPGKETLNLVETT